MHIRNTDIIHIQDDNYIILQEELAGNIASLTDVFHTPDVGEFPQ